MEKKYCLYVQSQAENLLYYEARWATLETLLKTALYIGGELKSKKLKPRIFTWQIVDEGDNAQRGEITTISGTYNYKGDMITKSIYIK